ncbi:MAG: hypothetical protein CMH83_09025 [Nocardioides sp.]|nr:hypothetical protein [Nocardioides sp.]
MRFGRRHAVLLLAVAVWNVLTFGMFARNLRAAHARGEERTTAYWVAHAVLVVVNYVIAAVLGSVGFRAWRRARGGAVGGA